MLTIQQKKDYKKIVIESLAYFRNRTFTSDIAQVDQVINHVREENLYVTDMPLISLGLNAAFCKYKMSSTAISKSKSCSIQDKEILIPYYREMMNDTKYLLTKMNNDGTRFLQ